MRAAGGWATRWPAAAGARTLLIRTAGVALVAAVSAQFAQFLDSYRVRHPTEGGRWIIEI